MIRALIVLTGTAAVIAFSPATMAAKKKPSCVTKKEQAGCKLKNAKFSGTTKATGQTYGIVLSIGENGFSNVRGALKANCQGGDGLRSGPRYTQLIQILKLPKTLTVGKTYSKSGRIDRVEDTGQINVRLKASESVKVKILSAKRAKVTIFVDQSSQNVEPPDPNPPFQCVGTGVETIKRTY